MTWTRPENIDKHPLRYSPLRDQIEGILLRRHFDKRLDGYFLETSLEIAETLSPPPELK